MTKNDIRWQQRLKTYQKALKQLSEAVELNNQKTLSNIEKQGFIKAFEFTHELAWKVMKDYFIYQGITDIIGSRDAIRESFQNNLITNGKDWMAMIAARNQAVHTYNESLVDKIIRDVAKVYYGLFIDFEKVMIKLTNAK